MPATIYKPSGVKVEVISTHDDGEYFMVRSNTTGKVFFAHKDQLDANAEDKSGEFGEKPVSNRRNRRQVAVVKPQVPLDNRLNLNNLTADGFTQSLPGIGLKTAQEIVDLRQSLPGERFTKLDQLKSIKKIEWDEVFATGSVYVE